jgi:hypothetical protein
MSGRRQISALAHVEFRIPVKRPQHTARSLLVQSYTRAALPDSGEETGGVKTRKKSKPRAPRRPSAVNPETNQTS